MFLSCKTDIFVVSYIFKATFRVATSDSKVSGFLAFKVRPLNSCLSSISLKVVKKNGAKDKDASNFL